MAQLLPPSAATSDAAMFKSVLDEGIMGNFYASVTGTSVIQQYEGDGGRGWCIFEQGTAMTVLAHLTAAEGAGGGGGQGAAEALPPRAGEPR